MADAGGLQLLPNTKRQFTVVAHKRDPWFVAGLTVLVLIVGVYVAFKVMTRSLVDQARALDGQISAITRTDDDERLFQFAQQTGLVKQYLDNHLFWTTGFEHFSEVLQPNIQLDSFSASATAHTISFSARAPNYTAVARQLASLLNDDAFADVTVGAIHTSGTGGTEFSATISLAGFKLFEQ